MLQIWSPDSDNCECLKKYYFEVDHFVRFKFSFISKKNLYTKLIKIELAEGEHAALFTEGDHFRYWGGRITEEGRYWFLCKCVTLHKIVIPIFWDK